MLVHARRITLTAATCHRLWSAPLCTTNDGMNRQHDEGAASAEVSSPEFAADVWPDGTPKRYRGRDAWKNWIEFNSPYKDQTDELNRQRHYFFHVDSRGRLWRKELHRLNEHDGQMRDASTLDFFFGHLQRNTTSSVYHDLFPFISRRAHEQYFTSCADAPIVFNDLRDGELRFLCPDGSVARSISTRFEPSKVRITADGKLLHPVLTKAVDAVGSPPRVERLMALIESTTAQQIIECCEEGVGTCGWEGDDSAGVSDGRDEGAILLRWGDAEPVVLRPMPSRKWWE